MPISYKIICQITLANRFVEQRLGGFVHVHQRSLISLDQRVRLDLNALTVQADFVRLETDDLRQTAKALRKLLGMTWDAVYRDQGLKWEEIRSAKGTYTLRISQKCRVIVVREGDFMRFLAIHVDHDSAYDKQ